MKFTYSKPIRTINPGKPYKKNYNFIIEDSVNVNLKEFEIVKSEELNKQWTQLAMKRSFQGETKATIIFAFAEAAD